MKLKKIFFIFIIIIFAVNIFSFNVDPNHILLFPSINGESGFIYNPSAYYISEGMISLGLHPFILAANIGIINLLELGINLDFGKASDFFEILKQSSLNIKCGVLKEEDHLISFAVGLERFPLNLLENIKKNETFRSYIVISRKISDMNFTTGIKKNLLSDISEFSKTEFMFDISKILNNTVLTIIEYDGQKYNFGFKISLNYNINVELFIKNIDKLNKMNDLGTFLREYFIFGITYIQ